MIIGCDIGAMSVARLPSLSSPPGLYSAVVDGATLVLTYDQALDEASVPATSAFTVTQNAVGVTVSSVDVASSAVVLVLASAMTAGTTVLVSYVVPGSAPVQGRAGRDVVALTDQAVGNLTVAAPADPAPLLQEATVNATSLVLTYDLSLDATSTPANGDFAVTEGGASRAVSAVVVSGLTVTLTIATVAAGGVVAVSYTAGVNKIRAATTLVVAANLVTAGVINNTANPPTSYPPVTFAALSKQTSTVTSHPITMPTFAANDAIGYIFCFHNSEDIQPLEGWTEKAQDFSGAGLGLSIFMKIAAGGETVTHTTTASARSLGLGFKVPAGSFTSLADITAAISNALGDVTPNCPSVTAPASAQNVFMAIVGSQKGLVFTPASPYTMAVQGFTAADTGTGTQELTLGVATANIEAATSDPAAWSSDTVNNFRRVAATLVIVGGAAQGGGGGVERTEITTQTIQNQPGIVISDRFCNGRLTIKNCDGFQLLGCDINGTGQNLFSALIVEGCKNGYIGPSASNTSLMHDSNNGLGSGHGIFFKGECSGTVVEDTELYGNAEDGVQFDNSFENATDVVTLTRVHIHDNGENGVDRKNSDVTNAIVFDDCTIVDNGTGAGGGGRECIIIHPGSGLAADRGGIINVVGGTLRMRAGIDNSSCITANGNTMTVNVSGGCTIDSRPGTNIAIKSRNGGDVNVTGGTIYGGNDPDRQLVDIQGTGDVTVTSAGLSRNTDTGWYRVDATFYDMALTGTIGGQIVLTSCTRVA